MRIIASFVYSEQYSNIRHNFGYNFALYIARPVRNVSGCTLVRNVMLECNKP